MKTLNVDLGERSYPIFIGSGLFKDLELLSQFFDKGRAVVVLILWSRPSISKK